MKKRQLVKVTMINMETVSVYSTRPIAYRVNVVMEVSGNSNIDP